MRIIPGQLAMRYLTESRYSRPLACTSTSKLDGYEHDQNIARPLTGARVNVDIIKVHRSTTIPIHQRSSDTLVSPTSPSIHLQYQCMYLSAMPVTVYNAGLDGG